MSTAMIVVNTPPGRVSGYLRTVCLEVHPNTFFMPNLSIKTILLTWSILEKWHAQSQDWDAVIIIPDKKEVGGVIIKSLGEQKRTIVDVFGVLCILKSH